MTRFSLPFLGVAAAISFAAPTHALQSPDSLGDGAEGTDVTSSTEIVCRRAEAPTGSRIRPRNICKTQHEWDVLEREISQTMWNERLGNRMYNEGAGNGCMQLNRGC